MKSTKSRNGKRTNKDDDLPAPRPKNTRTNGSHSRGRKQNVVHTIDENVDSTGSSKPQRRSSRLSGAVPDLLSEINSNIIREPLPDESNGPPVKRIPETVAKASRNVRTCWIAPPDRVAQSDEPAVEDEIDDLRRQLQQEKNKNRLLRNAAVAQASQVSHSIPKPKGSVGDAGFSLIAAMKLDKEKRQDKALYNDILATVRTLASAAGLDMDRTYRDQSITKLSKLMLTAREAEPYLAMFEDDWATGQILRQFINSRHKYENAKANGKVKVGEKRKLASMAPATNKRMRHRPDVGEDGMELESQHEGDDSDIQGGDGTGSEYCVEDEEEWLGTNVDVDGY